MQLHLRENWDFRQGRIWRAVHRSILAQRFAFFRGAIRLEFHVCRSVLMVLHCPHFRSREQSRGVIVLVEDDPEGIDEMLMYLYTLSDHINVPLLN